MSMTTSNYRKEQPTLGEPVRCSHCLGTGKAWDDSNEIPFIDSDMDDGELVCIAVAVADIGVALGVWFFVGWQEALVVSTCVLLVEIGALIALYLRRSKNNPILVRHQEVQPLAATADAMKAVSLNREEAEGFVGVAYVTPPIMPASSPNTDRAVAADTSESASLVMDWAAIEQKRRDTVEVRELLAQTATPTTTNPKSPANAFATPNLEKLFSELPDQYIAFAKELSQRSNWPQNEYASLARSHGVMPGAALERINEAAQVALGDLLLLEENETILLNPDLFASP